MFYSFFIFLNFSTSIGFPMICIFASQLIVGLGPHAMVYKIEINLNVIVANFLNAVWCTVLMTIYAMLLTYIV